jgi:hypothetical protein
MSETDLTEVGMTLVRAADDAGITARLLGGVAISLHSPSTTEAPFSRAYEDIDLMIDKKARKTIDEVATACGFAPDQEFNNMHGLERRTYYSDEAGKLDVFVGEFSMCHTLSFDGRLEIDHPTVPLADLVLTKAQIYELNNKDAYDLLAILTDHPLGDTDDETVSRARISEVCGGDWGMWRTVNRTLATVEQLAATDESLAAQRTTLIERIGDLRAVIEAAPKSTKWKMRARVGDRKVWYTLPEDPERHHSVA